MFRFEKHINKFIKYFQKMCVCIMDILYTQHADAVYVYLYKTDVHYIYNVRYKYLFA